MSLWSHRGSPTTNVLLIESITTARLNLAPLRTDDADEMFELLDDDQLYEFIGEHQRMPKVTELRDLYVRYVAGTPEQTWLNWIVRVGSRAVGTVQATVVAEHAQLAWIVGTAFQSKGVATEAARAMVSWLLLKGIRTFSARIRWDNLASRKVASRLGLSTTSEIANGEIVWRS